MTKVEIKAREELRGMFFEYLYAQQHHSEDTAREIFHEYYARMEFYCNIYNYDITTKSEQLENNWRSYYKKHYND